MKRPHVLQAQDRANAKPTRPWRRRRAAAVFAVVTATAVLIPGGAATARGGDWEPVTGLPSVVDAACGTTGVHLTFRNNKEFHRDTTLPDGTVVSQVTGSLTAHFVADNGATLDQNIGGPGVTTSYPNKDVRFHSEGHFNYIVNATEAAQLGVPNIFSTTGLIDFIEHRDGTATPITMPNHVIDVCAQLGLGLS